LQLEKHQMPGMLGLPQVTNRSFHPGKLSGRQFPPIDDGRGIRQIALHRTNDGANRNDRSDNKSDLAIGRIVSGIFDAEKLALGAQTAIGDEGMTEHGTAAGAKIDEILRANHPVVSRAGEHVPWYVLGDRALGEPSRQAERNRSSKGRPPELHSRTQGQLPNSTRQPPAQTPSERAFVVGRPAPRLTFAAPVLFPIYFVVPGLLDAIETCEGS
jgi:hypothetical protein